MLTAQDEGVDQIVGLEIGADDYLVKPVEPQVLLARIKTLLRRIYTSEKTNSGKQTQITGQGFSIVIIIFMQAQSEASGLRST